MITSIEEGFNNLATAADSETKRRRFGISTCCDNIDIDIAQHELDLARWKMMQCEEGLTDSQLRYLSFLPVNVQGSFTTGNESSVYNYTGSTPGSTITTSYNSDSTSQENVIEVNVNGALVKINLNSLINVDNTAKQQYTHEQLIANPVWTIEHNLGFVPGNELTTDLQGNEIEGVTRVIDVNTIEITFSEPVAGYAYVS